MPRYEYKVVPAPSRGLKAKGVKTAEARFSHTIEGLMNQMASEGWEYQRAETLPSIERSGLTSTTTEWRNLLIFRRATEIGAEAFAPDLLPPPADAAPLPPVAEAAASPSTTPPGMQGEAAQQQETPSETPLETPREPEDDLRADDEARKRSDASDVSDSPIPQWLTDARKSKNPDI
jgi:hypothetical protein